jgi:hypothetical protein
MTMSKFTGAVAGELKYARKSFPAFHSAHEAYAVILEEVEEFWEQVKTNDAQRDSDAMLGELIQIAAMAQRAAEDLKLIGEE